MARPWIVVEHLEPVVGEWVRAEYRHLVDIVGAERVAFTNTGDCDSFLREIGRSVLCFEESVAELRGILYASPDRLLVLDPSADRILEPGEAGRHDAVVIGGILGDHPPRGRTRTLLTRRLRGAVVRSLGPHQYSIDGAAVVYMLVEEGQHPYTVRVVLNPVIRLRYFDIEVEEELPFAYPVLGAGPEYPPELPWLLERGLTYEEFRELEPGRR